MNGHLKLRLQTLLKQLKLDIFFLKDSFNVLTAEPNICVGPCIACILFYYRGKGRGAAGGRWELGLKVLGRKTTGHY